MQVVSQWWEFAVGEAMLKSSERANKIVVAVITKSRRYGS
jgi:hypothetical protein